MLSMRLAMAALVAATTLAPAADAHTGATGVVKERMELMKDLAAAAKTLAEMVRGLRPFDAATATRLADKVAAHAGTMVTKFPKGSTGHPSEAKPEIWTNWSDFAAKAEAMGAAAVTLSGAAKAAKTRQEITAPFAKVAQTCGACHRDYRVKK